MRMRLGAVSGLVGEDHTPRFAYPADFVDDDAARVVVSQVRRDEARAVEGQAVVERVPGVLAVIDDEREVLGVEAGAEAPLVVQPIATILHGPGAEQADHAVGDREITDGALEFVQIELVGPTSQCGAAEQCARRVRPHQRRARVCPGRVGEVVIVATGIPAQSAEAPLAERHVDGLGHAVTADPQHHDGPGLGVLQGKLQALPGAAEQGEGVIAAEHLAGPG